MLVIHGDFPALTSQVLGLEMAPRQAVARFSFYYSGGRGKWLSEFEARLSFRTARAIQRNPVLKIKNVYHYAQPSIMKSLNL